LIQRDLDAPHRTQGSLDGGNDDPIAPVLLAHPKSLVAGALLLMMAAKTMFSGPPRYAVLHNLNLVLCPALSLLCFRHAFVGRRPLFGKSETYASLFLGVLSLVMGVGERSPGCIGIVHWKF